MGGPEFAITARYKVQATGKWSRWATWHVHEGEPVRRLFASTVELRTVTLRFDNGELWQYRKESKTA